jgi:hypothetical protein
LTTLANIFISHSRKDASLIASVHQFLANVGHTPIIEEFIPESEKLPIPHDEIQRNVSVSDAIFLFLTDNVLATDYTRNWVVFEVGLARQASKRVFVFERHGVPIPYPIPYVTDYMIFDPQSISDLLAIQTIAKELVGKIPAALIGAGAGAFLGAAFGPLGFAIGAITLGLAGHGADVQAEARIPVVECPYENCHVRFRYYSPNVTSFNCPTCRQRIALARWV